MPMLLLQFDQIDRNPFRDTDAHPITEAQIETLRASIQLTTFWEGLVVRLHPKRAGRYQLASGHSRLEAAKRQGLKSALFNVVDLDDDQMVQHLAVENVTRPGVVDYGTYRESITAAIERIMSRVVEGYPMPADWLVDGERARTDIPENIKAGGMPGVDLLGRYFNGVLSRKAILMVAEEYKATGQLAAWHRAHNPGAANHVGAATLSAEALGQFSDTAHVKTFSDTVRSLGVPVSEQASIAEAVLARLKVPETKRRNGTAEGERAARQWARTEQPRHERLTSNNIRTVVRQVVSNRRRSPKEKARLRAEAHAISVEGAMGEMSIGLRRAAAAASDIMRVAEALGNLHVDMTPSARLRLGECVTAIKALERSLKAAAKHGIHIPLMGA